ncbi:MAG: PAS domain-containing sensor histidine kinase [Treponema sp.]|jgi:signal transduction histidine kinase|nr:PAS domain-containing sensor histidine kinase [Treponema sp.]
MIDFYKRALKKLDKLDTDQRRELLISAVGEISFLETVLDSLDVGILVCDEINNLVLVNKFAQHIVPLNYVEGVPLVSAIDDERIVDFIRETLLNRDRVLDREIDVFHKGRNRLLSFNVLPLVQKHRITGSLVYIEDITEKRKTESRLRRAENLASLSTLAAGVAHEIKNPLASISIHLQLLEKTMGKILEKANHSKTDKYFSVIKEEIDRLNSIVVDFLFAVRPFNLELRKVDINKLINNLIEFITLELEQSKIICKKELDEKLPVILIDERLIKQALLNLIKNAQAVMTDGGYLTITTNCSDNEVKIKISDTGAGIKEENIPKIFEPYFTTNKFGTGLGLTLVYKIIREHQGEISVVSIPGEGSVFEIVLPVPQNETRMIEYNEMEGVKT